MDLGQGKEKDGKVHGERGTAGADCGGKDDHRAAASG
jgi:hypothetical protein